jgi:hypothetical protein
MMNQNKGNVFKFFVLLLLGNLFQSTTTAVYANANDYTQVAENNYSSWSIIVIADFHGAETFSFDTNTETNMSFQYHLKNFRKGFADGFNSNAKKEFFYGKNLVRDSKAVVQSTPKGTAHENLSYAHQHKNVLFITVDLYEQVSTTEDYVQKKLGRGSEGAVTGTVIGQHLE